MNSSAVAILIHNIVNDKIVSSIKHENNVNSTMDMVMKSPLNHGEIKCDYKNYDEIKLCLNYKENFDTHEIITVEAFPNENCSVSSHSLLTLNFPTLIKCQNCETNFPTKYQYQRHQCDFNAAKFLSIGENANNDSKKNAENAENNVYECPICYKIFINKNNLERHQSGHSNNDNIICEFCGKHFVSENRLRIHKENHCKKAGDISKFYRSDITVWKCKKCHEIFPSVQNANHHVPLCQENVGSLNDHFDKENIEDEPEFNVYFENEHAYSKSSQPENNYIETISTEILLQCEFCNRTFSDKNVLLMHQRKHTTAKNYECVSCNKVFDSYTLASAHWLKKCSDFANIFYLPKLSFCEYCDKTFKSHEILYNHKIKKRHYTPKLHIAVNVENNMQNELKTSTENKNIINRLIQDVLKTLEMPSVLSNESNIIGKRNENVFSADINTQLIKTEPESGNTSTTSRQVYYFFTIF